MIELLGLIIGVVVLFWILVWWFTALSIACSDLWQEHKRYRKAHPYLRYVKRIYYWVERKCHG